MSKQKIRRRWGGYCGHTVVDENGDAVDCVVDEHNALMDEIDRLRAECKWLRAERERLRAECGRSDLDQAKLALNERRSVFVYEAARLAAIAAGAPVIPEPWEEREEAFRAQFRKVIARQCTRDRKTSAAGMHDDWVEAYRRMGWKHGPVRDPVKKTHPGMVLYYQLERLEQDKRMVFMALCEIARLWIRDPGLCG